MTGFSISLLFTVLLPELIYSQTDYEFWFAAPDIINAITFPPAYDTTNIDRPIILNVSTADGPAIVTISQPANPAFPLITDTIQTDQFLQIELTQYIDLIECKPANNILNKGLLITSNKAINAVYEIQNRINSETYSLKGRNALGNEFIIPSQKLYSNYPFCDPPARNSIAIVGTEDETTVKIIPSTLMEGQVGLDTINILLNRGQTWCGRALTGDTSGHLGGTFVLSSKPIAVTVTDDAVRPDDATGLSVDIAGDQLIPGNLSSTEYIVTHYVYNPMFYLSMLYIYAYQNNTTVNLNGSFLGTINRGEVIQQQATSFWTEFIQSNNPIQVYVFLRNDLYSSEVSGQIVPALTCAGSKRVSFARTGPGGVNDNFWVYLVTQNGNQANFTCSNPTIQTLLVPSNFVLIPSTGNQWGFYLFATGWPVNSTLTFSNSTGNFQATAINELRPGALRYSSYTSYSSLNLGPDQTICQGESIALDASYGRDSYIWSTGATTQTITVNSAGTYWVNVSEGNCYLSDTIVITNVIYLPVNLGPDTSICPVDSIRLNAGTGKSWYLWSTGQTTQSIFIHDPGTYWVTVPVSHCNFTDSDTIKISLFGIVNLGPDRMMCPGDSTLLDAGAGMSGYLWNTGQTTQIIWAKSAGIYFVIVQKGTCISSDSINLTYYIVPQINLGQDTTICAGQTHTFDAGFCAGCTYQWDNLSTGQKNIGNNQTYSTGQAGSYRASISDQDGCRNYDTVHLNVIPGPSVSITIAASANPVCQGTSVDFTASQINGGINPTFHWKVNGINTGTNNPIFAYIPSNGDTIICILNSNLSCASNNPSTSNYVIMVINANLEVAVSIAASANPVCAETSVTYTASPVNGGFSPYYQWKVNDINVGNNSPVYIYTPANGDVVVCVLNSSITCINGNPVASNQVIMEINSNLIVSVSINGSANPVCAGTSVTFAATSVNGGVLPSYQWKVNGSNVGINSSTYTYNPTSGDLVSCIFTSSLPCTFSNPVCSNTINMNINQGPPVIFTKCNDTITYRNAKPFMLKGGIPLNGIYSGSGVNSMTSMFVPSLSALGNILITYTYTNAFFCSSSSALIIKVLANPVFICGQFLFDIRDNQSYPSVQIGSQCWFSTNLNYGIQISSSIAQRDNCVNEKYCYNNNPVNCNRNGSFYQWDELMQYDDYQGQQGLCPPGWHIPTENDWQILFNFFQGVAFSASQLLYTGFSGFNAFVTGTSHQNNSWDYWNFATFFWSSTNDGSNKAWAHGMNNKINDNSVSTYPSTRSNAFFVRCLKD